MNKSSSCVTEDSCLRSMPRIRDSIIDIGIDLIPNLSYPVSHPVTLEYKWHLLSAVQKISWHLQPRDTVLLRIYHLSIGPRVPDYLRLNDLLVLLLQVVE